MDCLRIVRGIGANIEVKLGDGNDELVQRLGMLDYRGASRLVAT